MKNILRVLAAVMLLALPVCAMAAGEVSCYWQLEAIEAEYSVSTAYGPAIAETDVLPVTESDPARMTEIVRGVKHVTLDVTRENGGYNAHGEYTLSGVPAVVPGAACARLTITANTAADEHSFYLYASLLVDGQRALRVRDTGAWVQRVYFPRTAQEGAVQRITLDAREIHDFAHTQVTYVYRAHPGVMVIDGSGDVVLYDLDGNEIQRIPQTVEDILPVFAQDSAAAGKTIFAAEEQEDGSLVVRYDPDSGLTEDELIRLVRAAASGETDTTSSATFVSGLEADENDATLYIAPNTDLSDDVLRALLRAASGKALSVDAVSEAVTSGEVALVAEPTATPAPLTYSQLREKALNPQAYASETAAPTEIAALSETAEGAKAAQALLLYDDSGVQGIVLTPGAQASGSDLLETIDKVIKADGLKDTFAAAFGDEAAVDGVITDEKSIEIVPCSETAAGLYAAAAGSSTLLSVMPGSVDELLAQLDGALVELSATPTPTPTPEPTPTPTAVPTATPTAEPTATPTAEPTATPTAEPTATPTAEPTATPTAEPTATPTAEPTATPTAEPTATPTAEPTATPTAEPTATPTADPTAAPTDEPTTAPTAEPTVAPTPAPTEAPAQQSGFSLSIWLLLLLLILIVVFVIIRMIRKK